MALADLCWRFEKACLTICVAICVASIAATVAKADCCADLDARVAELEATAVQSGNRKIDLSLEGTVTNALLYWNDGKTSDAYVVTNDNYGTDFYIDGDVDIGDSDWSAGFSIDIGLNAALSSEVNQIDAVGSQGLEINEAYVYVDNDNLGQLSWGELGGSSNVDDATEMDLSGTRVVAYSGVEDVGGGFFLRRSNAKGAAGLTSIVWSDLIDHLSGISGSLVRYDMPTIHGIDGWAEGGQGPLWEVALAYGDPATFRGEEEDEDEDEDDSRRSSLIKGLELAAAISYQGINGDDFVPNNEAVGGSVSVLHKASGFNVTLAAGQRFFTESVELNDGTLGRPRDASFYYVKPGLLVNLINAGRTGFYAEHGRWRNFLGSDTDAEDVAGLAGLSEDLVCSPGKACLVSGSEAIINGFGVVQHIESADMAVFIGFRHFQASVDLTDNLGGRSPRVALKDFATIMTGAAIDF